MNEIFFHIKHLQILSQPTFPLLPIKPLKVTLARNSANISRTFLAQTFDLTTFSLTASTPPATGLLEN